MFSAGVPSWCGTALPRVLLTQLCCICAHTPLPLPPPRLPRVLQFSPKLCRALVCTKGDCTSPKLPASFATASHGRRLETTMGQTSSARPTALQKWRQATSDLTSLRSYPISHCEVGQAVRWCPQYCSAFQACLSTPDRDHAGDFERRTIERGHILTV